MKQFTKYLVLLPVAAPVAAGCGGELTNREKGAVGGAALRGPASRPPSSSARPSAASWPVEQRHGAVQVAEGNVRPVALKRHDADSAQRKTRRERR